MATHNFNCRKCHFKFSIENDITDINRLKKKLKRGIRCPQCDDEWGEKGSNILHEIPKADTVRSLEKLRKSNAEATAFAAQAAAQHMAAVGREEMVEVRRPKNSTNVGVIPGNEVERVPKRVIDSLQYKQGVDPQTGKKVN